MRWQTCGRFLVRVAVSTTLASSAWAQQAVVVNGSPALRFEHPGNPPSHLFVERVTEGGKDALEFPIMHPHQAFSGIHWCAGNLYVFEDRVIYRPSGFTKSIPGQLSQPLGYDSHAFDLPISQLSRPVSHNDNAVWFKVRGKLFFVEPMWDPLSYKTRQSPLAYRAFLDFLAMALNDFPSAERVFRTLPVTLASGSGSKLTAGSAGPASTIKPAKLLVSTDPQNAQIFINGELKGTADQNGLAVDLPAGTYQLRVVLAGYKDFNYPVTLSAGDNTKIIAPLELTGPPPFTVGDVTDLLNGGVSSKRVAVLVQQRGVAFVLDDDSERKIRAAGGDAELLLVISKAKK